MRELVSQGGELLPNETRQDETRPGSVRGEANGEGQSHGYQRLTSSSAQALSSSMLKMHFMLRKAQYSTT